MISLLKIAILIGISLMMSHPARAWTVTVQEQEIQEKLNSLMPVEWRRLMGTIILTEPLVRLEQDRNALFFQTRVEARMIGGISRSGEVALTGSLEYQPSSTSFYLRNIHFDSVIVDGLKEPELALARSLIEAGTKAFLQKNPVYVLKPDSFKKGVAKMFLKSTAIENGTLVLNFSLFD